MKHAALPLAGLLAWTVFVPLQGADKAEDSGPICTRVRFFPAPGHEEAMVGGKFTGSNVSPLTGFQVLAEIKTAPADKWTELAIENGKLYRWLRYEAPKGSHGNVAEIEFYAGEKKLTGPGFGSFGERGGRNWRKALDNDTKTWFDSDEADGQYVGIDLTDKASARTPDLSPKPGEHKEAVKVMLRSTTPGAVIRYTLDGTVPGPDQGKVYNDPIAIDKTSTLVAIAYKDGMGPSPVASGIYLIGAKAGFNTFHIGNSLTNTTGQFANFARTAGVLHDYRSFTAGGALTKQLWDRDKAATQKDRWEKLLAEPKRIDHFTVQPRDFNIEEEADYDIRFFNVIREKSPEVQPWLYIEWVEKNRGRPTDKGLVPSSQMKTLYPALTWEESMAAMLLYGEELQLKINQTYKEGKKPKIIPSCLAMGWIKNMIDHGKLPGAKPGSFYPMLFSDSVHPNVPGGYLVDLTWYAAFYKESPEGKVLPLNTGLTAEQALAMQRLAWDVVKNYPDCGLYEEGKTPVEKPTFAPAPAKIGVVTPVTLSSKTPGAWFRYTLDGTTPTRTRGYVYCGVVSVRPGMTLKAVAYKSGMVDSPVAEATYTAKEGKAPDKQDADLTTKAAADDPDYKIQGEYEGEIAGKGKYAAQVVALGSGKFDVYFLAGGLPGAGWDTKTRTKVAGSTADGKVTFTGDGWSGAIAGDTLSGKMAGETDFSFKRVERKSTTLGAKPPEGAVVLFDGKNADEWAGATIVDGNLLYRGTTSKKGFATGKLHVEFRTSYQPKARGQGRGNSGVYILGKEIQVLDSFGLNGENNECGAFYSVTKPLVNMCLPPLVWQTYDVEIKPDDKGDLKATVLHNGVKVHEDFPIAKKGAKPAGIYLQDHGNPVVYRNIWMVETKADGK